MEIADEQEDEIFKKAIYAQKNLSFAEYFTDIFDKLPDDIQQKRLDFLVPQDNCDSKSKNKKSSCCGGSNCCG